MKHLRLEFFTRLLTIGVLTLHFAEGYDQNMATYSGGAGKEVFYDAHQLLVLVKHPT